MPELWKSPRYKGGWNKRISQSSSMPVQRTDHEQNIYDKYTVTTFIELKSGDHQPTAKDSSPHQGTEPDWFGVGIS